MALFVFGKHESVAIRGPCESSDTAHILERFYSMRVRSYPYAYPRHSMATVIRWKNKSENRTPRHVIKYTIEKKWVVASLLINAKKYILHMLIAALGFRKSQVFNLILVVVEWCCSRLKCMALYVRYYHFVSAHSVLGTVKFAIFAD